MEKMNSRSSPWTSLGMKENLRRTKKTIGNVQDTCRIHKGTYDKYQGTYRKNKEPAPPQQKVTGADLAQATFWAGTPRGPAGVLRAV